MARASNMNMKIDTSELLRLADAIHLERAVGDLLATGVPYFGLGLDEAGAGYACRVEGQVYYGSTVLECVRRALIAVGRYAPDPDEAKPETP